MSFLCLFSAILTLTLVTPSAHARAFKIDPQSCEIGLNEQNVQSFIRHQSARRKIFSNDGRANGNFIPDPTDENKLINLRGSNYTEMTAAVIRHLKFDQDVNQNPNLAKIIESVWNMAHEIPAALTISSFDKNGERNIRLSLDMNAQPGDSSPILRLPELEIKNGEAGKRVDIDITPTQVSLVLASTLTYHVGGQRLVGEAASHTMGLLLQGTAEAPVITTFDAKLRYFIGPKPFPGLPELLSLTERLTRTIYPAARVLRLQQNPENTAINDGSGWNLTN